MGKFTIFTLLPISFEGKNDNLNQPNYYDLIILRYPIKYFLYGAMQNFLSSIFPVFSRICLGLVCLLIYFSCNRKEPEKFRILTAGIKHESSTFNPYLTNTQDFDIKRGSAVLEGEEWAEYLKREGIDVIPTLHVRGGSSGLVANDTYESFRSEIIFKIRQAGTIDGIYLDMHGALHVEGYPDAQLDFIQCIRKEVGNGVLISGSFDLHGNMSSEFARSLDILTAYRTAPHVDQPQTRLRAVNLLVNALRSHWKPVVAHINVPILIPGEKGITAVEPLKSLYDHLPDIAMREGLLDASIFVGMPWTDIPRAGMSIQVVAQDKSYLNSAQNELRSLAEQLWKKRSLLQFDVPTDNIIGAVDIALKSEESTIFITDSGDNITAGAAGNNTLVLEYLISKGVRNAIVAGIVDPEAVRKCDEIGLGNEVSITIGGKIDAVFGKPLEIKGIVKMVSNYDSVTKRKPVVIELDGIDLVLLTERRSFLTPRDFEEVGLNPLDYKIVVVKLGYLFQDLRDIAPIAIMALTPGFANQQLEALPYQNLNRPIYPLDEDMKWNIEIGH